MKKIFPTIAAIILMYSFSSAQTTIPGGNVSGTWIFAGSPYLIQGAIMIPNDSTLTIEPGVTVNFQGTYKLYMQGRLLAIGTVADSITFTAADTTNGWRGIRFDNTPATNDTSKLIYCKIQYSKVAGSGNDANGGALYFANFSKAIVSDCHISNNSADDKGGGIYCYTSSPIITYNTISNNSASDDGGGIYCGISSPTITNNIIFNNSASSWGGGIYCNGSSSIITNNTISNNSAYYCGGGICCDWSSLTITNNTISYNSASSYGGGGIHCYGSSSPIIINNTISNNSANYGGGVYCSNNNSPTITNNTISNNDATNGGALYCNGNSDPTLQNTILWGNTANTSGSQVFLYDEDSDPNFYYCDVQGSTSAFGLNGIFYTGTYENNIDADPLFVAPSDSITADWSLQIGSPCINAGTPDTTGLDLPTTDLAGNPRIIGGHIDIGAYEYQGSASIYSVNNPDVLLIYPNPVTDYFFIETLQKSEIEISNIEEQIIKRLTVNDNLTTVDLSNLSSGVYIIKAKTEKGIAIKKFIKQ